jgi:hypothetical protein
MIGHHLSISSFWRHTDEKEDRTRSDADGERASHVPESGPRTDQWTPGRLLIDANLKGRIAELRRIRDAVRADAERAEANDSGRAEITSNILEIR